MLYFDSFGAFSKESYLASFYYLIISIKTTASISVSMSGNLNRKKEDFWANFKPDSYIL